MLELTAIMGAVKALLEERLSGEPCYLGVLPDEFSRPSSLVESGAVEMTDGTAGCLGMTTTVKVTLFPSVDANQNNDSEEVARRMMNVLELFAIGYLGVEDRALHVIQNTGQCQSDRAVITVQVQYQDDQPGEEDWPMMSEVQTNLKGEI